MTWFIETIYAPENISKNMKGFLEVLTMKGKYHNIYLAGILNSEDKNKIAGYTTYVNFASYKTGIHFGGKVAQNTVLTFDQLNYKEQSKSEKAGIGQIAYTGDEKAVKKVVVPLMTKRKKKL